MCCPTNCRNWKCSDPIYFICLTTLMIHFYFFYLGTFNDAKIANQAVVTNCPNYESNGKIMDNNNNNNNRDRHLLLPGNKDIVKISDDPSTTFHPYNPPSISDHKSETGNLSYYSIKLEIQKESKRKLENGHWMALELDYSNWGLLDSLAPYNFDLCMRQYSREFYADPVLNSSNRTYPIPLSIFSRGSSIHVTLCGNMYAPFPNYDKWLRGYEWRVKVGTKSWTDCPIIKGDSRRADKHQVYFLLRCENVPMERL